MIKFVFGGMIVAVILLIASTGYLVWLNWNEKFYAPLLSIVLIGTATTLVTVLNLLKEEKIRAEFTTSVIIDEEAHLPLVIVRQDKNEKLESRLSDLFCYAFAAKQSDGQNGADFPARLDELLQYKVVRDIQMMQYRAVSISQIRSQDNVWQVKSKSITPYRPSDLNNIPGSEIFGSVSTNRFSQSESERVHWENSIFSLPPSTHLALMQIPSSEQTVRDKYVVRLEKPLFFTINIKIEGLGATGLGSVLEGIYILPQQIPKCRTYIFKITMEAEFQKWTAGNKRTEEYKEWVKWLFAEMKDRVEDK